MSERLVSELKSLAAFIFFLSTKLSASEKLLKKMYENYSVTDERLKPFTSQGVRSVLEVRLDFRVQLVISSRPRKRSAQVQREALKTFRKSVELWTLITNKFTCQSVSGRKTGRDEDWTRNLHCPCSEVSVLSGSMFSLHLWQPR